MKALVIIIAVVFGIFGIACSNACEDALDKLEECGVEISDDNMDVDECDDDDECFADCIEEADCSEIKAALGMDMSNAGGMVQCMAKCIK